eukprot:TRINITY_DN9345_c0_g4_i1.p1 TRINITY_DN9345_c0_g4~~TRINITY_DN9345_c0_g4_i1.p1  ORF type:complete len:375 (-),score=56.33 TRINITY_DN9345_c0_g4_i1:207-1331(-)
MRSSAMLVSQAFFGRCRHSFVLLVTTLLFDLLPSTFVQAFGLVHEQDQVEAVGRRQLHLRASRLRVESEDSCAATTADVAAWRQQRWPRQVGAAPRISRLVYINLNESLDRREWMEEQFRELRGNGSVFEADRFPALTTAEVKNSARYEQWRKRGFSQLAYPPMKNSWATAANLLSHYEAIRQHSKKEMVMILEDDVWIEPNFQQRWEKLWPFIPDDWDVLRVGGFLYAPSNCTQKVNDHIERASWADPAPRTPGAGGGPCIACGTQALIVRPESVSRVLKRLEAVHFMHTDTAFSADTPPLEDSAQAAPLNVFMVRPFLVRHDEDVRSARQFASVRDIVDSRETPVVFSQSKPRRRRLRTPQLIDEDVSGNEI